VKPPGDADEPRDARSSRQRGHSILRAGTNGEVAETVRLDHRQRRHEVGGCDQVGNLAVRDLGLSRIAGTFAEAGEVEGERGVAALGEPRCIDLRHLFLDREPRAGHDDSRLPGVETGGVAEHATREPAPEPERHREEHDGAQQDEQAGADIERLAGVGGPDDPREHREHHEAEHVVDHRGAEDDARFVAVCALQVLQHARRDADARRGQRGPEEDVHVHAVVGEQESSDEEAEQPGRHDAEHGDDQ